ncbi:hypothetical protein DOY81_007693 [Sarcophaga bullata]|nr:hypothetical protein DOY81_007693 [Sarcophaga bullata]
MSQNYGIRSKTYNIPFNNNKDVIFATGCSYFYNFLYINNNHGKLQECDLMTLKMHLEFDGTQSEAENIALDNSNNGVMRSVQQLEAKIKTLEDALRHAKDDASKLKDRVENLEKNNVVVKTPDVGNIKSRDNCNKETNNESILSGEHNFIENIASSRKAHQSNTIPEEKPEVFDLRHKCVYIQSFQCSDTSLDVAFSNVRKLANEMNARIPDNSVIHIDVDILDKNYLDYYVYFRDAKVKTEFLKNRFIYEYNPHTSHYLRILDYSDWGVVEIRNFLSSDLSIETAFDNVIELANKMGLFWNIRKFIDHIDVYSAKPNVLTYFVTFKNERIKNEFLRNIKILKFFPETSSLQIFDIGGHTLNCDKINCFSIAAASANVIGIAEEMGLSFDNDNFKRICVLNTNFFNSCNFHLSLIVEFSNKHIKDVFLKEKYKLKQIEYLNSDSIIIISDIKTEENIVSIKYETIGQKAFTVLNFIGFTKQLGLLLTRAQINRLIELSDFISYACYIPNI